MDATLNALGGLLRMAVPTVLLVLLLHYYLKYIFFRPLEKVLAERAALTEGARKEAEASFRKAEELTRRHAEAIQTARAGIHQQQEELRREWKAQQAEAAAAARRAGEEAVGKAKDELVREAALARLVLEAESRVLATRIADSLLAGRAQ